MNTLKIPEINLEKLAKRIERMNNKADKLGLPRIEMNIGEEEMVRFKDDYEYWIKYVTIEIGGEIPKVDGWSFIAVLDHTDKGNVIRTFNEDIEIPEEYKTTSNYCDHCNINRYRKDTYLLYNEDSDSWKQVGRTCLKDFTGYKDVEMMASFYQDIVEISERDYDELSGGFYQKHFSIKDFVELTAQIVTDHGFISKSRAEESIQRIEPTASRVLDQLIYPQLNREITPTEEAKTLAKSSLDWIRSLDLNNISNDYLRNLHLICCKDYIEVRDSGFVASLVTAYERAVEKENRNKDKAEETKKMIDNSKHIGTVKDKIEMEAKLDKIIGFETYYGYSYIHIFIDNSFNVYKWVTNKVRGEEGNIYKIKGTVKDHEVYNNVNQTVLTRCKVAS